MSPKALPLLGDSEAGPPGKAEWGAGGGAEPAPPLTLLLAPPPALLQAFPRAAATDGVDPGGRGARRPPAQLLHGQRRRPPSGPAAAARRGLRAAPAQVGPPGGRREGAPFPDTASPRPRVPASPNPGAGRPQAARGAPGSQHPRLQSQPRRALAGRADCRAEIEAPRACMAAWDEH